ncbi:MAG: glycosyltransferase family 2 protein [Lachnospiraceae bacterium]
MNQVKVDVIIPVYRPQKGWEILLERLSNQTFPVGKIILMNTGEAPWKEQIEACYPRCEVHLLTKEEFDHGGTRHQGTLFSEADYLLFLTQDAVAADEYLVESLVRVFMQDQSIKAAYGRQLPFDDCREIEKYTRSFNYPEQSCIKSEEDLPVLGIKTFFCSNVCAMYERKTYLAQGGFTRHTIFNEDMIYAGGLIKSGYKVAYVAEARVYHSHNYNASQQFHRNFDLAVSQADHPEVFAGIRSEKEGIRLVIGTAKHLVRMKKPWLLFPLLTTSAGKILGYKLGQNYRRLSKKMILKCTMNPSYWR